MDTAVLLAALGCTDRVGRAGTSAHPQPQWGAQELYTDVYMLDWPCWNKGPKMHFIVCPPWFPVLPQPLAGGGCLRGPMSRAAFSRYAPKDKIPPSLFLGLAWSVLHLPQGWGRAEPGPWDFCLTLSLALKKYILINQVLYSGWFVFVYLGVSYDLCFSGTHLELGAADGFGSHAPGCLQSNTSVTCWWQAGAGTCPVPPASGSGSSGGVNLLVINVRRLSCTQAPIYYISLHIYRYADICGFNIHIHIYMYVYI